LTVLAGLVLKFARSANATLKLILSKLSIQETEFHADFKSVEEIIAREVRGPKLLELVINVLKDGFSHPFLNNNCSIVISFNFFLRILNLHKSLCKKIVYILFSGLISSF